MRPVLFFDLSLFLRPYLPGYLPYTCSYKREIDRLDGKGLFSYNYPID